MKRAELYCEGYHDRAFLAGWLEARHWTDPGAASKGEQRRSIKNPLTGKAVLGGRFAFQFKDAAFLEIIPGQGKQDVVSNTRHALQRAETETPPPDVIVLVCDLDEEVLGECQTRLQTKLAELRQPTLPIATPALIWHAIGDFGPGVPTQQTLERVVCCALSQAHPDRGKFVAEWLASTGHTNHGAKSHSWSHMAGWYAEHGCEDFLKHVWREPHVRQQLDRLLDACGAQAVIDALERQSG